MVIRAVQSVAEIKKRTVQRLETDHGGSENFETQELTERSSWIFFCRARAPNQRDVFVVLLWLKRRDKESEKEPE